MGRDYTRFLVLGEGRTGSNLLVQALNSHPNVVCYREVFNWTHKRIDYNVEGYEDLSRKDVRFRADDPLRLLDERIFRDYPADIAAVGLKLHYGHAFGFAGVEEALIEDQALRVVHLRRQNMLRTLVSLRVAEQTGVWEHDEDASLRVRLRRLAGRVSTRVKYGDPARVRLTYEQCNQFFIVHALQGQRYDELFAAHPVLQVRYEDLAKNRDSVLAGVQRFLGVPFVDLKVTLQRQSRTPLRETIVNFDELRAAFAGTSAEALFDE